MFDFIIGNIVERRQNSIVLACNGIGYELIVSTSTISISASEEVKIFTYLQVKEDGITLFGFHSKLERDLFLNLISISGIGGKLAIAILSGMSVEGIVSSIKFGDIKALSGIKGVGKKTAERIILELKGKLGDDLTENISGAVMSDLTSNFASEAIEVLVSLGIQKSECSKIVDKAIKSGLSGVEEIISFSLKNISR